jgi:hypothetical protein
MSTTDLFGNEVPIKQSKEWEIPLDSLLAAELQHRNDRTNSPETKHSSGGYQNWVRDTVERLRCHRLTVDYFYIGKTFRHAYNPSGGGWEGMCRSVLAAVRAEWENV